MPKYKESAEERAAKQARKEKLREMYQSMTLPEITENMIDEYFSQIPIDVDRRFIKEFILNGQSIVQRIIEEDIFEDEGEPFNITM